MAHKQASQLDEMKMEFTEKFITHSTRLIDIAEAATEIDAELETIIRDNFRIILANGLGF